MCLAIGDLGKGHNTMADLAGEIVSSAREVPIDTASAQKDHIRVSLNSDSMRICTPNELGEYLSRCVLLPCCPLSVQDRW